MLTWKTLNLPSLPVAALRRAEGFATIDVLAAGNLLAQCRLVHCHQLFATPEMLWC